MYFSSRICPFCAHGSLIFMRRDDDGALYLECDECMTTYTDVNPSGELVRGGFSFEMTTSSSSASASAIERRGWSWLVRRTSASDADGSPARSPDS